MTQHTSRVRRPRTLALTGAVTVGLLGAALATVPGAALAAGQVGHVASCKAAKHRYIEADSATVSGKRVTITGHHATFHPCGPDDGHYDVSKATKTYTATATTVIKVYPKPENPTKYVVVKDTALPHWLKVNRSEPIYQITTSNGHLTTMTERFHP